MQRKCLHQLHRTNKTSKLVGIRESAVGLQSHQSELYASNNKQGGMLVGMSKEWSKVVVTRKDIHHDPCSLVFMKVVHKGNTTQ